MKKLHRLSFAVAGVFVLVAPCAWAQTATGSATLDATLAKLFPVTESFKVDFRSEFFNLAEPRELWFAQKHDF